MSIPLVHFVPFVSLSAEERTLVQRIYSVRNRTKLKVQVVYSDEVWVDSAHVRAEFTFAHNGKGMFRETGGEALLEMEAPSLLSEEELARVRHVDRVTALYSATRCAYRIGARVFLWRFVPRPFTWNDAVRFLELDAIDDSDQGALVLLDWAMSRGIASEQHALRIAHHYGNRTVKPKLSLLDM